jgi:hypothetical protein
MYIFKYTNLNIHCYFCVVRIIKNFVLKFYLFVGYIIEYVKIYFHIFFI